MRFWPTPTNCDVVVMSKPAILFCVSETGSASWTAPLWQRWKNEDAPCDFRIVHTDSLDDWFGANDLQTMPRLTPEPNDVPSLNVLLAGFRPDVVVSSAANRNLDDVIWQYCEANSIPCAVIIDTWYGYRKRLTASNKVLRVPDAVLVIDERACKDAVEEGLERDTLHIIGHPAWEQAPALPPADEMAVAFISQPIERHYGTSLGYTEVTALERLIAFAESHPDTIREVQVCPHPEESKAELPVRPPARLAASSRDAIASCGTVIGMFSSILTDSCLGGRKTISWQPDASDVSRSSLARFGYIPLATDEEGLLRALEGTPSAPKGLATIIAGSTERLESFIVEFAS